MSEAISTGKHSAIKLEVYQEVYSLSAQNESKGKYYPVWATYKKNKDEYQTKDWPVKVTLGLKPEATAALLMILKEITGIDYVQAEYKSSRGAQVPKDLPKEETIAQDVKDFEDPDGVPF
jgi:hypothetical protein